jgi:cysteine synthase A
MLKQFANPVNPEIHRETTAEEIWLATEGRIDAFVCGVSTGGAISGIAEGIKTKNPKLQVIAVEPTESSIISGSNHSSHKIQGISMGFIPKNRSTHLLDSIEQVSTHEASAVCHSLATKEAILAGISSGASICAALRVAEKLGTGKVVVTIVRDTGERYLSMKG